MRFQLVAALVAVSTIVIVAGCRSDSSASPPDGQATRSEEAASPGNPEEAGMKYVKPSDEVLRKKLTKLQYQVTQGDGTEPPFRNAWWDEERAGLYVDVVTGEPLFSSTDKFKSGTGWPSFTRPVDDRHVVTREDRKLGMVRTEVRSVAGDSHLGHVFQDGPAPTHQRYCVNSAALRFVPVDELEEAGYGAYLSLFREGEGEGEAARERVETAEATQNVCTEPAPGEAPGCESTLETAILAGGCFWGMEDILREVPGVLDTDVGYTGGKTSEPTYQDVRTGRTGHAEAVQIVFDPSKLSYADLLEEHFFRMHDPTTVDRQGNDVGTQYRSAIFYTSEEQRRTAERVKARVEASGVWKKPIVTEITEAGRFQKAEDYHQDYLEKRPSGYTCHYMRDFDE